MPIYVVIALVIVILVTVAKGVRIVPQANAAIVERLGRYSRTLEPGLHILIPYLDRIRMVRDMREQVVTFQPQPVITKDNVTISVDTVIYFSITDPFKSVYEIANLVLAAEQLTITTLRNVIGTMALDEALSGRDKINADLRIVLDEATEKWGIRVSRIEVKSIDPPLSIQEAMEAQMRAERNKRAAILNAEGEKQAAILTAEGSRQSQILRAEADRQAQILAAEGGKQSQILRAEGEAQAINNVFSAIHAGRPTPDLLTYQYLNTTLPSVANGQAMKLLLMPSDSMGALAAASAIGAGIQAGQDTAADPGVAK